MADINEYINVDLSWEDCSIIAVCLGEYQRLYKDTANKDTLDRCKNITNKIGELLYDTPNND